MTVFPFSRRRFLGCGLAGLAVPGWALAQSQSRDVEGGIGGTGIVGILTDFGSLIIAGKRVQTDALTEYRDAFGRIEAEDLRLGDNLTIEAYGPSTGLVAQRVVVTNPLVGVVSDVAGDGRTITVNSTPVDLASATRTPAVGDRVGVSGLWRGDRVAGGVIRAARAGEDLVAGTATRRGGRLRIGPVVVRGRGRNRIADGSFATAIGQFDPASGTFVADRIAKDRFAGTDIPLKNLSIEGYLEPVREAPGYRVSGLGHSFKRNLELARFEGRRVLFDGPYDGLFAAQSAVLLPEDANRRRRLFRDLIASD